MGETAGRIAAPAGGDAAALAALYEVATRMLATLDLDEVLLLVANASSRLLTAEIAGIFLYDAEAGQLVMRQAVGHQSADTARLRIRRGEGLAGRVLDTGRLHRVGEYTADTSITKEFQEIATAEGTHSAMCAPMMILGQTIGTLSVWRRRRSIFTDSEGQLLTSLAQFATMAVRNADLFESEHRATARLREAHRQLEQRYELAERSLRVHQALTALAAEGADVESVGHALEQLVHGTVAGIDPGGQMMLGAGAPERERLAEWAEGWLHARQSPLDAPSYMLQVCPYHPWLVISPVRAASHEFGYLTVGLREQPDGAVIAAIEQGATVCALLMAREEAAMSATSRLQSEFIWDLLEGRIPDEAEATARARHLGRGFQLPARVVLLRVDGLEDLDSQERWPAERIDRARSGISHALGVRFEDRLKRGALIARRADRFAVIVPDPHGGSTVRPRDLAVLAVESTQLGRIQRMAGVSGVANSIAELPDAFRQAQFALSGCSAQHPTAVFDDLGVLRYLMAPADRGDLDGFVADTIGPLIEYDKTNNAQLVTTLRAYMEADCNLKRAAASLFVHHKTMAYRLGRIQWLSGLDLVRQEDRFRTQLALKILALGGDRDGDVG